MNLTARAAPGHLSTLCVGDDPPEGSVYWYMPPALRITVARSFRGRVDKKPGFENALANGFWKPGAATPWEALDRIDLTDLNVMCVVFDRVTAIIPEVWSLLLCIEKIWYGSSCGFACVYDGRPAVETALSSSILVARDQPRGAAEHQDTESRPVGRFLIDSDCHCWRELGCTGVEGLHFCVGTSHYKCDGIHWDWKDPANGKKDGFCTYDSDISIPHLLQTKLGVGIPPSPFWLDLSARRSRIASLRERAARLRLAPHIGSGGSGTVPPDIEPQLTQAEDALPPIEGPWEAEKRGLAAMGSVGRDAAQGYNDRAREQVDVLLDTAQGKLDVWAM